VLCWGNRYRFKCSRLCFGGDVSLLRLCIFDDISGFRRSHDTPIVCLAVNVTVIIQYAGVWMERQPSHGNSFVTCISSIKTVF
jgi:hypothetical protein